MDQQSIICTVCPMGCQIHVAGEADVIQSVRGIPARGGKRMPGLNSFILCVH